jgi:hypothetical protein
MKSKKEKRIFLLTFIFFSIIAAVLLIVLKSEKILSNGKTYKLKVDLVNQYDPTAVNFQEFSFLDRYYPLHFKANNGDVAYLTFTTSQSGFIEFKELFSKRPKSENYLKVRIVQVSSEFDDKNKQQAYVDYKLSCFYTYQGIDKHKKSNLKDTQPKIQKGQTMSTENYIIISVLNGESRIKGLVTAEKNKSLGSSIENP